MAPCLNKPSPPIPPTTSNNRALIAPTVNAALADRRRLGVAKEVTGCRRGRVFEYAAHIENRDFHDGRTCRLVAEVLRLGCQRFERPSTRRLIALVRDHGAHRNAMMGAHHPAGENALLHQVQ
jgi:hypothetical protein